MLITHGESTDGATTLDAHESREVQAWHGIMCRSLRVEKAADAEQLAQADAEAFCVLRSPDRRVDASVLIHANLRNATYRRQCETAFPDVLASVIELAVSAGLRRLPAGLGTPTAVSGMAQKRHLWLTVLV